MKKKKNNPFLRIISILFIIYAGLCIANKSGYYEKKVYDKTVLTGQKIAEFEEDIQNNEKIDIKKYLSEKENYSNVFTKSAQVASKKLAKILTNNVASVWDFFKTLFIG